MHRHPHPSPRPSRGWAEVCGAWDFRGGASRGVVNNDKSLSKSGSDAACRLEEYAYRSACDLASSMDSVRKAHDVGVDRPVAEHCRVKHQRHRTANLAVHARRTGFDALSSLRPEVVRRSVRDVEYLQCRTLCRSWCCRNSVSAKANSVRGLSAEARSLTYSPISAWDEVTIFPTVSTYARQSRSRFKASAMQTAQDIRFQV